MKKIKCVCLFMPESKVKNFKKLIQRFWGWEFSQSGAFALPLSSNQVFGVRSSANQVLLLPRSRPIRAFGAGSSANQVLLLSGFRPVRFFEAGSSVNQVPLLYHSRPISFFGAGNSAHQMRLLSHSRLGVSYSRYC
jgi:hypothetical protein